MMRSCKKWWGDGGEEKKKYRKKESGELQYFFLLLLSSFFFLSKIQLQSMNGMEWNWCPPWLLWWERERGRQLGDIWGRGFNKGKQIMFIWNIFLVCLWDVGELELEYTKKKDEEKYKREQKIRATR